MWTVKKGDSVGSATPSFQGSGLNVQKIFWDTYTYAHGLSYRDQIRTATRV